MRLSLPAQKSNLNSIIDLLRQVGTKGKAQKRSKADAVLMEAGALATAKTLALLADNEIEFREFLAEKKNRKLETTQDVEVDSHAYY